MTLIELVLAVGMMTVVVAVMAPILHGVQGSWAAKEGNSEALAHGRAFLHHFHQQLSQAVSITDVSDSTASQGYIQFITCDDVEARYALDAQGDVQFGPLGALVAVAGPASAMRFTCYDGNDFDSPTTDVNSICLIAVEATFRNSNPSGRDHTLSTSVYIRAQVAEGVVDPGVAIKGQIHWGGIEAVIDSYRSSEGPYDPADPGSQAVVTSNAFGPNEIVLSGGALLRGSAYIGPGGDPATGISVTGGAQITGTQGTLDEAVEIPDLSPPTGPPFDGSPEGDFVYSAGTRVINSNRHFNNMSLTGSATVMISGDVTILVDGDLRLENTARVRLQPPAKLRLYVGNDAIVKDSATINSVLQNPRYVLLYVLGSNNSLRLEGSARVWTVVQNPGGTVEIVDSAKLYGRIKGGQLDGSGQIHVDLDAAFE